MLKLLSAGAAKGLVSTLASRLAIEHGVEIDGTFNAVGAIRKMVEAGEASDLVISTKTQIEEMVRLHLLCPDPVGDIGTVETGIAVRSGYSWPRVTSSHELISTLRIASAIYVPDSAQSTAGRHMHTVLARLGIYGEVASQLRNFPNGETAMQALAADTGDLAIGFTQVTEILYTVGLRLVGPLPEGHRLSTIYSCAISNTVDQVEESKVFLRMLIDEQTSSIRREAGFGLPAVG